MSKIVVTGGCGYIGSHTIVDLIENGHEVISVDNFSRSHIAVVKGIEEITGLPLKNYAIDCCDQDALKNVFQENPGISGIIHFAAYKAVHESVADPLLYYRNNLVSLVNILACAKEFDIPHFVFSSSCTVYGNPDAVPVTEDTPLKKAASPYGFTKQIGEQMINDVADTVNTRFAALRYFNPAGAHPSAIIGEMPVGKPQNLVPAITQTACGLLPAMLVHGGDYPTRDGSCVRDYIHVCDLAHAHTLALQYLQEGKNGQKVETFNLGIGEGVTVLEAIRSFEKISNTSLNYKMGPKRPGDVVAVYANNTAARHKLGWQPQYSLEDIMATAWKWECRLQNRQVI